MLTGTDGLFGTWLVFFRDQLSTILSAVVLLPLTLFLNWRLALVLIVLVCRLPGVTAIVVRKTETAQRRVEGLNSALAGTAQDALSNVMVVQSFTRLQAEAADVRRHRPAADPQPVPGAELVGAGQRDDPRVQHRSRSSPSCWSAPGCTCTAMASVGEIVSFMGIAMLLIGRLETAGVVRLLAVLQAAGDRGLLRRAGRAQPGAGTARRPQAVGAARRGAVRGRLLRLSRRRCRC